MRVVDANDTSGELGSVFPGSLVGESVFSTAKLEMLIESAGTNGKYLYERTTLQDGREVTTPTSSLYLRALLTCV